MKQYLFLSRIWQSSTLSHCSFISPQHHHDKSRPANYNILLLIDLMPDMYCNSNPSNSRTTKIELWHAWLKFGILEMSAKILILILCHSFWEFIHIVSVQIILSAYIIYACTSLRESAINYFWFVNLKGHATIDMGGRGVSICQE